jgi:uncharacterized protein
VRLLLLILLVVVAVWVIRRAFARPAPPPAPRQPPLEGQLVACARCGLNLPRAEAREAGGEIFCSDEHARLGRT